MDRLGDTGRPKVWVATSSVAEATLYVTYARSPIGRLHEKGDSMAKAAAGAGSADSSVADQLRELGVRGVLVQMAERGQLLALKCEMPQCYHHKGRGAFDQVTTPRTKWAPSPDHYPVLKSAGGHLRPENVRLPTSSATTGTMDGGSRSERCSRKASPSPRSRGPEQEGCSPGPRYEPMDGRHGAQGLRVLGRPQKHCCFARYPASRSERAKGTESSYRRAGSRGGPRLTWPWRRNISSSSSMLGLCASAGGSIEASAGTEPSRTMRSRPAGVLSTSTRAVSLSTRKVCATPIGTAPAPPGDSSKRWLRPGWSDSPPARRSSRPEDGCAGVGRRRGGRGNRAGQSAPPPLLPGTGSSQGSKEPQLLALARARPRWRRLFPAHRDPIVATSPSFCLA